MKVTPTPTAAYLSGVVHSRRMGRTFSIGDMDPDTFSRIKNYDETVGRLDHYYGVGEGLDRDSDWTVRQD